MILYSYYCLECEQVFEAMVDMKDRDKVKCPKCKKKLRKHIDKPHLSSKRVTYGY